MKYVPRLTGRAVSCLLAVVVVNSVAVANAEIQSGQVLVQAVHGVATYSVSGGQTLPVKENLILTRGATVKTAPDSTVDLILQYNGTVLRLLPGSTLKFDKLNRESAAEGNITETSLNLVSGSILGSQRKLASPSTFEVNIPGGVATIKGTEYVVRADGAVSVLSGSVQVNYVLPGNGGAVKVTVPAGMSFDPATGRVVVTTPAFLQNIIADIDTVRNNAKVFKTGGANVIVRPENVLSPTKGNSGVGNGSDGSPPGHEDPPGNRGVGNPNNRGHNQTKVRVR
jgi:hypothetical protein